MGDERQYSQTVITSPLNEVAVDRTLQPLTELQQVRVEETRLIVYEKIPEMVDFIKSLHKLGMINGWRDVHASILDTDEDHSA